LNGAKNCVLGVSHLPNGNFLTSGFAGLEVDRWDLEESARCWYVIDDAS
jgi:hypothetical protein